MRAPWKRFPSMLVSLAALTLFFGCGGETKPTGKGVSDGERPPRENDSENSLKDAIAADDRGFGSIAGSVLFAGAEIPPSTMVPVGTDPQFCGMEHSKENILIDPESRGIRNVIITLRGENLAHWPRPKPERLLLDNKNCRFEPHAAVLTVGSILEIQNSDPILHTVHAYFGASFNVALPKNGTRLERSLARPGLIQFRCDKHGWMNAYLLVDPHPFHAVTDSRGRFAIPDLPPGAYTLSAWHEQFGSKERKIVLQKGKNLEVNFSFTQG